MYIVPVGSSYATCTYPFSSSRFLLPPPPSSSIPSPLLPLSSLGMLPSTLLPEATTDKLLRCYCRDESAGLMRCLNTRKPLFT